MPRKPIGKRLEKVVSTTLPIDDYLLLEKYARNRYINHRIKQPTISHMLRSIIEDWTKGIRKLEQNQATVAPAGPFQIPDNNLGYDPLPSSTAP